jgi:hypothetical protein
VKPQPDTAQWWQEVAQGLGVKIHEQRMLIEAQHKTIQQLREALEKAEAERDALQAKHQGTIHD